MYMWTFMEGQHLLVYKDDKWFETYKDYDKKTCEDLVEPSQVQDVLIQKGRFYGQRHEQYKVNVVQRNPSYWFFAIGRCRRWQYDDACLGMAQRGVPVMGEDGNITSADVPAGVYIQYEIEFLNPGGYWRALFSADEQGLFEINIIFLIFYMCILCPYFALMFFKWDISMMKSLMHLLTICIICGVLSNICWVLHWGQYAYDGMGIWEAKTWRRGLRWCKQSCSFCSTSPSPRAGRSPGPS